MKTQTLLGAPLVRLMAIAGPTARRWRFEGGRAAVYPKGRAQVVVVVVHDAFALAAERTASGELRIEHAEGLASCARRWIEGLAEAVSQMSVRI